MRLEQLLTIDVYELAVAAGSVVAGAIFRVLGECFECFFFDVAGAVLSAIYDQGSIVGKTLRIEDSRGDEPVDVSRGEFLRTGCVGTFNRPPLACFDAPFDISAEAIATLSWVMLTFCRGLEICILFW